MDELCICYSVNSHIKGSFRFLRRLPMVLYFRWNVETQEYWNNFPPNARVRTNTISGIIKTKYMYNTRF